MLCCIAYRTACNYSKQLEKEGVQKVSEPDNLNTLLSCLHLMLALVVRNAERQC